MEDPIIFTKNRSLLSAWWHRKKGSTVCDTIRRVDIINHGSAYKIGTRFKRRVKRYFILRLSSTCMTLSYYTNDTDYILCGSELAIGAGYTLQTGLRSNVQKKNHNEDDIVNENGQGTIKGEYGLRLCLGTRIVFEMECFSQSDFNVWKIKLQQAIDWNESMVLSSSDAVVKYGTSVQNIPEVKKKHTAVSVPSTKLKNVTLLPKTREGYTNFMVNTTKFSIPIKYEYQKVVGSGAYGVVISANVVEQDEENETVVAIKNIQRAFDDLTDAKRIVREIKLMRHLQHKALLSIVDIVPPSSLSSFEDVYIVSECMATDLHRVVYSRHALSSEHVTYFLYQMLTGLLYLHSANVIHRDLKPSNILLNGDCTLKICDFGLARGICPNENYELTEYVVTRWYRAPEIMLGVTNYTAQVDVWSIGCIFAEMISRKPLFPGQDYIDQLQLIMNVIGPLPEKELTFLNNDRAKKFMTAEFAKRGAGAKTPLRTLLTGASPVALDLMEKMLHLDPSKRITVAQALEHEYFSAIRNKEDEIVADAPFDFSFENQVLEKKTLQSLIYEEIVALHPEISCQEEKEKAVAVPVAPLVAAPVAVPVAPLVAAPVAVPVVSSVADPVASPQVQVQQSVQLEDNQALDTSDLEAELTELAKEKISTETSVDNNNDDDGKSVLEQESNNEDALHIQQNNDSS